MTTAQTRRQRRRIKANSVKIVRMSHPKCLCRPTRPMTTAQTGLQRHRMKNEDDNDTTLKMSDESSDRDSDGTDSERRPRENLSSDG